MRSGDLEVESFLDLECTSAGERACGGGSLNCEGLFGMARENVEFWVIRGPFGIDPLVLNGVTVFAGPGVKPLATAGITGGFGG